MDISEEKVGNDVTVAGLLGRLDPSSVGPAEKRLLQMIDGGARWMVLDLSGLDYISSAGLRVLLTAAKKLKTVKGQLLVCSVKKHVKDVFDLSGFSSVFPICADRAEALARPR